MKKQYERARAAERKALHAVFAFAPNGDTRLSECLALADEKTRDAYESACAQIRQLEIEAIAKGKAWRNSTGGFYWSR